MVRYSPRPCLRKLGENLNILFPKYPISEGDSNDFDWALEFSECAVNKFYEAQGIDELKPYCNFFDVTYSKYLNMGIDANMTIGVGCSTCKLKYTRGRETIPDPLRGLLP